MLQNIFYLHVWWWCFFSPKKAKKFYYWKLHGMNNHSAYLQVKSEENSHTTNFSGNAHAKRKTTADIVAKQKNR